MEANSGHSRHHVHNNGNLSFSSTPRPHHPPPPPSSRPLPGWARFYFYGMQGLLDEVLFTATFDLLFHPQGNPTLKGYSTLASFFIYGMLRFLMEHCFLYCLKHGHSLAVRVAVYVAAVYVWEFCCGLALRQVDACSWDYSHYPLNLLGLVTLLYAPAWTLLCLFQDFLYQYIFSLHVTRGVAGHTGQSDVFIITTLSWCGGHIQYVAQIRHKPKSLSMIMASGLSIIMTSGLSMIKTSGLSMIMTSGLSMIITSGLSMIKTSGLPMIMTSSLSMIMTSGLSMIMTSGLSMIMTSGLP
ncbi:hypothetical protein ACOMHN_054188 [Nucella lapillus]